MNSKSLSNLISEDGSENDVCCNIFNSQEFCFTTCKEIAEKHQKVNYKSIWASTRQNPSSGFPTKQVSNQSPQLQRLARKSKFHL